jgi:hypothetical protein
MTPQLFARVHESLKELQSATKQVPFVLQIGDLLEGLCGSE